MNSLATSVRALIVLSWCTVFAGAGQAAVLFDNGPIDDPDAFGRCDQGPVGCGGSGTWTYYDDFTIAGPSIITGFDYTDWFDPGTPADYIQTNWSVFTADPFTNAPIATGTAVATLSPTGPVGQYLFTVGGINPGSIVAPAGTYWLGINNTLRNSAITTVAEVAANGNAKQSDGADLFFSSLPERAFRIYGSAVPEPSAIVLALVGVVAAGCGRKRRPIVAG